MTGGLDELLEVRAESLSHADQLGLLTRLEQLRSRVDAQQQRLLARLGDTDASEQQWVREEVACTLHIAPCTAASRLADAADLVHRLPAALHALSDAVIGPGHVRVLIEATGPLTDTVCDAVQQRVLPRAAGKTVAQFRQAVRRAVAALDTRRTEQRHHDALTERRVVLTAQDHGMSELWALLPADTATALMTTLNLHADTLKTHDAALPGEARRTADQRRADALGDLARTDLGAARGSADSQSSGHRPLVQITVSASTLLDLDDQPGDLYGHGPIPAAMARRIATDPTGTWRRLVLDPAHRLIDASRTYRPPTAHRHHVTTRDTTCRFPGCRRHATRCDLDHITPFPNGPTHIDNLHALCPRHHHLKHQAPGWTVHRDADHTTVWTTPTGQHIYVPPEPLLDTG